MAGFSLVHAGTNDARAQAPAPNEAAASPLLPYAVPVPVPKSVRIIVLGDSLADGIWGSLYRKFVRDRRYTIYRGAKNSVGFGGEDLLDMIDKGFASGPVDAVVMMVGANDRRGIHAGDRLEAAYRSPQWPDAYGRRVERFMDAVAQRKVPLVWILLPIMREAEASQDARQINEIIRAAAATRPTVRLVESWPMMADAQGAYSTYLKDAKGQSRLLRHTDGVHFSELGYDMMAEAAYVRLLEASQPLWLIATEPPPSSK